MNFSDNQRVNEFLIDLQSISPDKLDIIESIRHTFNSANPELIEEIKYGGLVFNLSNSLIGGVFAYKNHVSIEFSYGCELPDPNGMLEGKGKKRRHLKIINKQDIQNKNTVYYIENAVNPP